MGGYGKLFPEQIESSDLWFAKVKLIALLNSQDFHSLQDLCQYNLHGALFTHELCEAIADVIRAVAHGATFFSQGILKALLKENQHQLPYEVLEPLSQREHEVWRFMQQGYNNTQIAAMLQVSEQTVRNYVTRVYAKFKAGSENTMVMRRRRRLN